MVAAMKLLAWLLPLALCACGGRQPAPRVDHATLAFTHVRVFDGEHVLANQDVLVDGDRIVAVGPDLAIPSGATIVEGTGRTLLPGLFDAHAHIQDGSQLEQSLAFGVTTVLDMFTFPQLAHTLRAQDRTDRADLRSAGFLATAPGGHGTEYGFEIPTITAAQDAQAFADARFAEGSDYLKIVYDGGSAYGRTIPTISAETLRALIEAAHARNKLAVVHIGSYAEARTALESGADGLMHLFRDQAPEADFGALAARTHAFVTPTLAVLNTLIGVKTEIGVDPAIAPYLEMPAQRGLAATFPIHAKATPRAAELAIAQLRDAHVPVLCGTDAPNPGTTYGASVHDELALLVAAGLPPSTALAGATSLPARRFGLTDRGRIAAGLRADLVLVDGDPTTTITDTRRIVGIWRTGVKFDRDAYRARVAEHTRAAQDALARGVVSDFEDGSLHAQPGQDWTVSTDALIGGTSKAALAVVAAGAAGHALAITGEVIAGGPASWAGAIYMPGDRPFAPADLSRTPGFAFRAKGDGKGYVVMVFTQHGGRAPSTRAFTPGTDFTAHQFRWSEFGGSDGHDITAILIGQVAPGTFRLAIDDVELR